MIRPKYPPIINTSAIGLPDAYYKLIKACLEHGALKKRFYGKPVNTLDIVSLTEINHPLLEPMLHPDFPTKELHLKEYEKQWERDYDWKKQGFEYNYMDRLIKYPISPEFGNLLDDEYYHKSNISDSYFIDQLKVIREKISARIERGGECLVSNRDQAITWIPNRDMFVNEDQPCIQRIQLFLYKYPEKLKHMNVHQDDLSYEYYDEQIKGKAEFHVTWRSRDLYSAWNSNMIALIKMLNKEIFDPNNLELIRVIDFCDSLHLYEGDWKSAEQVKPANIPPNLMR